MNCPITCRFARPSVVDQARRSENTWSSPANWLTSFRFLCAPFLLGLAWHGYGIGFLSLLAFAFLSDALDGYVARKTGTVSEFGAKLDSWADMVNYSTIALGSWWLWPEIVLREWIFALMIVLSYVLPAVFGIIKFGAFTSYHTRTVKLAAFTVGLSLYILFLSGAAWPFRFAALLAGAAAIEEISITLIAPKLYFNVVSFRELQRRLPKTNNSSATKSDEID